MKTTRLTLTSAPIRFTRTGLSFLLLIFLQSSCDTAAPGGSTAADERAIRHLVTHFADAVVTADREAFAGLWVEDASWRIAPPIDAEFTGREEIARGFAGLMESWEFLIQVPEYSIIDIGQDSASGRWLVREMGRGRGGGGQRNYGLYQDRYVRVGEQWRFVSRDYRFVHLDTSAVAGDYTAVQ